MFTNRTIIHLNGYCLQVFAICIILAVFASACQPAATSALTTTPTPGMLETPIQRAIVETQPISGGPVLLRAGISLRSAAHVGPGSIKVEIQPSSGDMYILNPGSGLQRLKLSNSNELENVASAADMAGDASLTGMTFGPDGAIYVVANRTVDEISNQAIIRKGIPDANGKFEWKTLAQTEPYPLSNTPFDHRFNGALVSTDGKWLYVNSGSRTDHGEVEDNAKNFPDTREVALTARIFKIPTDAQDLLLPNDETALQSNGLIFARGTRNAFDMAFAPNGDLFAVDNGPDADFPDELNLLREGMHYGFPWQFGDQDNPQQFPDYTSVGDKRLSPDFTAVQIGAYRRDPEFPKSPGGFTLPVANLGPDAAYYRADDGTQHNAAEEGKSLYTFTPHRSPLGLVFVTSPSMPSDFRSDEDTYGAFLLSWGAAGGTLTDKGQDLLYLQLTKKNDNYEATVTQIARDFENPIDAVLVENRLYVLDFGPDGTLWELTFQ